MSVTSIGSEKRTLESNSQGKKKPADRTFGNDIRP